MLVPFGAAAGPIPAWMRRINLLEFVGADEFGIVNVRDIEERCLEAQDVAGGVGVAAEADEEIVADGMQIGGVAGDFEDAGNLWIGWIGEVEGEDGVHLAEGHDHRRGRDHQPAPGPGPDRRRQRDAGRRPGYRD